jgi:hypothetical protein
MKQPPAVSSEERAVYDAPPVPVLPEIVDRDVEAIVREIEQTGFAVIPSYIDTATLADLQRLVTNIIAGNGGEYAVLTGKAEIAATLLEAIGVAPRFGSLLRRVYAAGTGKAPPAQSLYQVLRCISGQTGLRQAYFFHYDSYVVTALLPIIIPREGQTGDLLLKANKRKVRSSYLLNLADKLVADNQLSQKHYRRQVERGRGGFRRVRIVPGNLYLFWGYRSLHANEPCDPARIRATALFHFGDPHADSGLRKFTGKAKIRATPDDHNGSEYPVKA